MKYLLSFILLLFSLDVFSQAEISKNDQSVVILVAIKGGKIVGTGTGFFVSPGIIVTNNHVADFDQILFAPSTGRTHDKVRPQKAEKLWLSPGYDLAILRVQNLDIPPMELTGILPTKGSKVVAIGFPGAAEDAVDYEGLESTVTEGIVGRVVDAPWVKGGPSVTLIQHSAGINSGNSGGPLIDGCGRVVGINTAKAISTIEKNEAGHVIVNQTEQINFASSTKALLTQLQALGVQVKVNQADCAPNSIQGQPGDNKSQNDWSTWAISIGLILTLILAGAALLVAIKKKEVIRETFTQFHRRSNPVSAAPQRNSSAQLELIGIDSTGQRFNLKTYLSPNDTVLLGRDASACKFVINDSSVSRQHSQIKKSSTGIQICDLNSTNGTWVNGIKVGSNYVRLKLADEIVIGKVKVKIYGDLS
ncbi:trypsin-like peptidase domain-containing protein [Polynucleobacter paneuropaeus]|uniref:trypsin-like peptidase domain-containing protein n=1 Tax=Polynucleobacter paneuropaeus TaxID=2527775 RepID=UPI001BFD1849|nr:trypsin-like peptidase domain-containing protein [Polynucleobacter paneuropaeus]MBT8622538.1 FHA domain-containing protein [Polynucleobacter paneuropaeus]